MEEIPMITTYRTRSPRSRLSATWPAYAVTIVIVTIVVCLIWGSYEMGIRSVSPDQPTIEVLTEKLTIANKIIANQEDELTYYRGTSSD